MPSTHLLDKSSLARCYGFAVNTSRRYGPGRAATAPQTRSFASSLDPVTTTPASTESPAATSNSGASVDISSLENTLHAHREANRASLIRKTYETGKSERIQISDVGLPALNTRLPRPKSRTFRKVDLSRQTGTKGTSRDLDVLWRMSALEKNPPLQYRLPWLQHLDSSDPARHTSAVERLWAEIRAFETYSSPSEEEQRSASDALQDVTDFVHQLGDGFVVDIIGSRATNLADPLSDLDINVSHPDQLEVGKESVEDAPFRVLNQLEKKFQTSRKLPQSASNQIQMQVYLKHARIPILLCHHKGTGLPIQIQSTPRTFDSREYVKSALREFPSLRCLFKVLKQLLQMRGLTVGSSGGITSYPLLQMIVAVLKFAGGRFHPTDVGNHFLFFLDFYSNIDFSKHGISTEPLELFSKGMGRVSGQGAKRGAQEDGRRMNDRGHSENGQLSFGDWSRRKMHRDNEYRLTLQDPTNPVNDLGKSCFLIQDVQETLIALRATTKRAMAQWDKSSAMLVSPGPSHEARSLLEPCIGGDYRIYEHERDDLRRFGRESLEKRKETVAAIAGA